MGGKKADMLICDPPYGIDLQTDYSKINIGSKMVGNSVKRHIYNKVIGDDKPFDYSKFDYIETKEQFWFGGDYYAKTLPEGGSWAVWDKRKESQDEGFGSGFELIWSKQKHKRLLLRFEWFGFLSGGDKEAINRVHPTQKPSSLLMDIIKRWGKDNDIILDLFLGSGSTLIACEKTNRICYGMEIDPIYIDVIVQRYVDFTGNNKVRLNGKEIEWEI